MSSGREDLEREDVERYGREFAERLREWEAGGPELTDEEADRYLAGMDQDELLVQRYLDGELSPEAREAVDVRLLDDDLFYRKARPFLAEEAALREMRADLASMLGADRDALTGNPRAETGAGTAALSVDEQSRTSRRPLLYRAGGLVAASVVALALVAGGIATVAVPRSREAATERREGRAITTHFWPRTGRFETTDRPETQTLSHATVVLQPHSRLTTGIPWPPDLQVATLDGGALLTVREKGQRVVTATADAQLARGHYEIVSLLGSGETIVRVFNGAASVRGVDVVGAKARVTVGAEQQVRVGRDGTVIKEVINKTAQP